MGSRHFDTLGAFVTFQSKKKRINLLLMEKKEYTCLLANADTTYASCVIMNVFYDFSKEAITRTIDIECQLLSIPVQVCNFRKKDAGDCIVL